MPNHPQRPRDERLIIGITGRIGSGKTSVGKYLASAYEFQYLRYSSVLSEWLAKDPEGKTQLQEVGWGVMAGGKQTELNQRLIAQVVPGVDIAVDGLRHPIDYQSLRNSFLPSFHLLYIDSHSKDRWQRLHDSGRYTSFGVFEAADGHPVERHIEPLRANAALIVQNQGSLENLYAAVDVAVRGFRKEGHI